MYMALILSALLAYLTWNVLQARRHVAPLPPGPRPWPFIGNVFGLPTKEMWIRYAPHQTLCIVHYLSPFRAVEWKREFGGLMVLPRWSSLSGSKCHRQYMLPSYFWSWDCSPELVRNCFRPHGPPRPVLLRSPEVYYGRGPVGSFPSGSPSITHNSLEPDAAQTIWYV